MAIDTEARRTEASQCVVDGCGRVGGARRRWVAGCEVCGVWCLLGVWRVCFWVVAGIAKRVKKLALVGLDPTTFGL